MGVDAKTFYEYQVRLILKPKGYSDAQIESWLDTPATCFEAPVTPRACILDGAGARALQAAQDAKGPS